MGGSIAADGRTAGIAFGDAAAEGWTGFTRVLLLTCALAFAAIYGALLAIDPYDTGRTGLIKARSVHDQYPFTGNVSRARDGRFDAAIFGNSHVQLLQPERLDRLTDLRFVQLTMPATWPSDHLDSLRWFLANRTSPPRALLVGVDHFWCLPEARNSDRFPAWLYSDRLLTYLAGLARYRSVEVAMARLKFLRSGRPGIRPDGYWDYAPLYRQNGLEDPEASRRRLAAPIFFPINETGRFPVVDRLRSMLAALPAETEVVLVWPPMYRTALPQADTPGGRTEAACRSAFEAAAAARPRTAFVDLLRSRPDDAAGFYDHDHVRHGPAIEIERKVAETFGALRGAR